jgi:predicted KAP-like P-loop ATPase
LGNPQAYAQLVSAVSSSDSGKPAFLKDWEDNAKLGKELGLKTPWDDPFFKEWLALPPSLADADLRGALYVSREHAPLITPEDRLSSEAAGLLTALLQTPEMAGALVARLAQVPRTEITVVMDRVLERARREQEWGVPPVLEACLAVSRADSVQGTRLAAFLSERPPTQIEPNIVPKIADEPWAAGVFDTWDRALDVAKPVKAAIKRHKK